MRRSTDRMLTTHGGSLPRPADPDKMIFDRENGMPVDRAAFGERTRRAVAEVVVRQLEAAWT